MQKICLSILICLAFILSLVGCETQAGVEEGSSHASTSDAQAGESDADFTEESVISSLVNGGSGEAFESEESVSPLLSGEDGNPLVKSGDFGYIVVDDTAHLCAYYGGDTQVSVPDELDGHIVTVITESAFADNGALLELSLGSWVVRVEDGAFNGCASLKKIEIGSGVAALDGSCFDDCPRLEAIEVNPSNMYFSSVNGVLFNGDKTVLIRCPRGYVAEEYTLPSATESVGEYGFKKCDGIGSVVLNSDCGLSEGSFYHCSNLKKAVFAEGLAHIPDYCFFGCVLLEELALPEGVEKVGDYAFFGCVGMKKLVLPSSLSSVADTAFDCCTGIEEAETEGDYAAEWYEKFKDELSQAQE